MSGCFLLSSLLKTSATANKSVNNLWKKSVPRCCLEAWCTQRVGTTIVTCRPPNPPPHLYRFFADRDAILDELLERHCAELDARCVEAEQTWAITSVADLLNNELDLHVVYYRLYPSSARLWMGGRTSPTVTKHVRARMQNLAGRIHTILVDAGLIPADTDPRATLVAVEMADRILELSFRDNSDFDEEILAIGRRALIAFGSDLARR